jgi:formimidoylglutamate deiminase
MTLLAFERALLRDGWAENVVVRFKDRVIHEVTAGDAGLIAEHRRGIAVPGMPNVHSHAFQRGMAGLAERAATRDDSFWTWREVMYRFLDRLSPDDIETIATLAYIEMVEAGFTSCVEFHYLHHDPSGAPYANIAETAERIAAAAATSGIGLTLLPVFYRFGNFGAAPPAAGQRRFLNDSERFAKLWAASARAIEALPGAVLGVAPHSLRAIALEDLRTLVTSAPRGPIHIHVAEQEIEVADCLAWCGRRPVEWLLEEMDVGPRWCLIHATHMTREETKRLAGSGAVAGLCPVTEANLGDGIFEATEYRRAGGRFGVGTDSNILIGIAEELRALEYAQRLVHQRRNRLADPGVSVGRALLDAALEGGAQASGRSVGAIAPGRRADFVLLDPGHPAIAGRDGDSVLDGWLFAARLSPVREVWVGGVQLVANGRHILRDDATNRFNAALRRLME